MYLRTKESAVFTRQLVSWRKSRVKRHLEKRFSNHYTVFSESDFWRGLISLEMATMPKLRRPIIEDGSGTDSETTKLLEKTELVISIGLL